MFEDFLPTEIDSFLMSKLDTLSNPRYTSDDGVCHKQFIGITPQAKQSVRFSHGRGAYTDPKKKLYVGNLVAKLCPYSDKFSFGGPVEVVLIYCFKWRKSDGPKDPLYMEEMVQRPDLDNMQKPLFDALTQSGMFKDDAAIVKVTAMKVRFGYEGIALKISDFDANDCTRLPTP
jgi:Holliday junction resolvase RusA-like endonuclease